jgi:putative ABC transport system permease protein
MSPRDLARLILEAFAAHRLRYALTGLAVVIGVGAVVLLSSIGEGTRLYILDQFSQFGTTIIAVSPGKVETSGLPGYFGGTARPLTLDDARALARIPGVTAVMPITYGAAPIRHGGHTRRVYVYGGTSQGTAIWKMHVAAGEFLPAIEWDRSVGVAVLGPKTKREIFGSESALGKLVRIGESRFRVIGVMEAKGTLLGFDLDDAAYIPVASAMSLFNRQELDEVDVLATSPADVDSAASRVRRALIDRHDGYEDFTISTQADMLGVVGRVIRIITGVVAGIAAISLVVGAIGILTIMWIVVRERTHEIGLAMAVGARRRQILVWYLAEAGATALLGGLAGLVLGMAGSAVLARVLPGLATSTPPYIVASALVMALVVGLASGILPAVRAARMDPVDALRTE